MRDIDVSHRDDQAQAMAATRIARPGGNEMLGPSRPDALKGEPVCE
jgi:hypothetical protein